MRKLLAALTLLALFCASAWSAPISNADFQKKPRLVVVLVVDQMRADYLTRFSPRFLPAQKGETVGGFEYLKSRGAYFPFAEYDVLQCMTGPGHAMILSGSYPYQMGISLNVWFDPATKSHVYCVQDPKYPVVGAPVDPQWGNAGLSPANFKGVTVGDELKNAGYPARVVSLALKDRAAILMGGHRADLAFWLDSATFRWVSSSFYLPEKKLPAWIEELNAGLARRKGQPYVFKAEGKPGGLSSGFEFQHKSTIGSRESLNTPLGPEITVEAAEHALKSLKLGAGKATDILAVSFSSHDYLGHHTGPNALEMEEMTVAEDRIISRFLNSIRKNVPGGLKDVVFVLTADHGIPPSPAWLASSKIDSGLISESKAADAISDRLKEKFGKPKKGKWVLFQYDLNFYLNREAAKELDVPYEQFEAVAKAALESYPGIARVFGSLDHAKRNLPPGMFERSILKSYIPGRNGDLVAIPKPFYVPDDGTVTHISRYTYDRTVPLVIAGPRIKSGVHSTKADIVDIAPTLSFILGIVAPATSEGRVLSEIF